MSAGTAVIVRLHRGRSWVLCALVAACCGCSALVDTANLIIRCEVPDAGVDPCMAVGQVCTNGMCQACVPEVELCDGRDNDCDGVIDNGFDPDNDGFTWCGGGRPELVDCAPNDPSIHPPVQKPDGTVVTPPELCDGKDNDCDGVIDEDPRCAPLRSCAQDTDCPSGLLCAAVSGQNQCVAPRETGSSCKSDTECGGGFCISSGALGLNRLAAASLCASACCKDQDCAEGSACVQSGSGARVCLPLEIAGRKLGKTGDACRQSSDCVSGVCQQRQCVATCSKDADCPGESCRLNVVPSTLFFGAGSFICGGPVGPSAAGDFCTMLSSNLCQSALCVEAQCAPACGSDTDCSEGFVCRYVSSKGLLGGGRVTACVAQGSQAAASPTPACCTNADCHAGQMCKPTQTSGTWAMSCQGTPLQ